MIPLLHQNLGGNEIFGRKFVVVEDEASVDGQFLIFHFLNLYLMKKEKVILVSFSNNFVHYQKIQMRVNMNLEKFGKSGKFEFWNGNSFLFEDDRKIPSSLYFCTSPDLFKKTSSEIPPYVKEMENLKQLEEAECELILIDNISPLLHFLGEVECMKFLMDLSNKQNRTVFVLSNSANSEKFNLFLEHLSGLYFRTLPLKSGYSKEVNGVLEIKFSNRKDVKRIKFKETEFSVKVIPS